MSHNAIHFRYCLKQANLARSFCLSNSFCVFFGGGALGYSLYCYSNQFGRYQCESDDSIKANSNNSKQKQMSRNEKNNQAWRIAAQLCTNGPVDLRKALDWTLKDYLLWYASIVFSGGLGFFVTPMFSFWVTKRHINKVRIGKLRAFFNGSFSDYFFEVYLMHILYGIVSCGFYFSFNSLLAISNAF